MNTQPTEADWADFATWSDRDLTALREGIAVRDERIEKLREALERVAGFTASQFFTQADMAEECITAARKALEDTQ